MGYLFQVFPALLTLKQRDNLCRIAGKYLTRSLSVLHQESGHTVSVSLATIVAGLS